MKSLRLTVFIAVAAALLLGTGPAVAQEGGLNLSGYIYTKWLWGNLRDQGSLYNFTTVPGEGYGDQGQGTEFELFFDSKVSDQVEIGGRIKARFSQNYWTNFGGFGGGGAGDPGSGDCVGGACGEFDSRSAQYMKLRGVYVRITPGYKWIDSVLVGSSDWGMFDPFVIGKIRYIDRDNGSGVLAQGSFGDRTVRWDLARISLPKLWAGPDFSTGQFHAADAAWGLQFTVTPTDVFDFALIGQYVRDIEVDSTDYNRDDGRDIESRFTNTVIGARFGIHPNSMIDITGRYYRSESDADPVLSPGSFFGISGFSPTLAGEHDDDTWRLNIDINDPFDIGLSFNIEGFDIGAEYVSMMAARRESDVLLTEGRESTYAFPGPSNARFGVFGGNPSAIGFGGWDGNAQQVATINVDNEFTDFDEPMAETAIGWKGWTVQPVYRSGDLELTGEYTKIDYNTNWQAWGDDSRAILDSLYPNADSDAGFRSNRNAYAPFQDRETDIYLIKGRYFVDVGNGLDIFGKIKFIDETDKRMNDARYLPYQAGDCPGGGEACGNVVNYYYDDGTNQYSSADLYGNPGVITGAGGVVGYQWAPFDDLSDDDRDMDFQMFQLGAGYQFSDDLYASLTYERFDVDLKDGNTAFQAYQLHEMASGEHEKNKFSLKIKYILAGLEFGMIYQYIDGSFTPDFGDGFVPVEADQSVYETYGYDVGTLGFYGRFGGWNSLETRDFEHQRIKAFLKVAF
jgi:hypothetical protein